MDESLKKLLLEVQNKWTTPKLENELKDLEAVAEEFDISLDRLKEDFKRGEIRMLPNKIWETLGRCDCKKANSFLEIVDIAHKQQKVDPEYKSQWKEFKEAFRSGKQLSAPVVMKHDHQYHLVSGNTRLMVAKVMNVTPFVYLFVS